MDKNRAAIISGLIPLINGYSIIGTSMLPENTIMVDKKLFEELKKIFPSNEIPKCPQQPLPEADKFGGNSSICKTCKKTNCIYCDCLAEPEGKQ